MANKNWLFTVVYQSPEDAHLTPAKRGEEKVEVNSTSANRALSKAKKEILEDWEGLEARNLVILDVYRTIRYEEI